MKKIILSKLSSLRKIEHWRGIYISPDLTPKEREANQLLRAELKRRKSAGKENLIIRRGKIVVSMGNPETDSRQTRHSASIATSN